MSLGDDQALAMPEQAITAQSLPPLQTYIQAATSDNTRKAYRHDIRHYMAWGATLPTTADVLITYLQHYAPELNARTLTRRLTAIKNWHLYQGFSDPTTHPLVRKTLIGIKNIHGRPKEKATAISLEALISMVSYLKSQDTLIAYRNNALLQIGFFVALRRSELVAIQFEDLKFVPQGLEILIPRSKTDQSGEGQICAIPYGDEILCPATALKTWCEKAQIQSAAVFKRIAKGNVVFQNSLGANHVSYILKEIASNCGLPNPKSYSGHSLRRGFATSAGQQNVSLSAIMKQGRWKHSDTALGYMEEGQRFDMNAAGMLLKNREEPKVDID